MTKTVQPRSCAYFNEAGKNVTIARPETEDYRALLIQIFDSLTILCEKLNRLDNIIQRKNIEQIIYGKAQ